MASNEAPAADPRHSAVLVMEMQRGVIGDLASMRTLADAVAAQGTVGNIARLLGWARGHGVRIIHCTVEWRADRAGTSLNTPLLARMGRNASQMLAGTGAVEIIPELAAEGSDLVLTRHHGLTPFTATPLDVWLRNLGVTTVIATGVSVNIGVVGMCIEAANLGYRVVVPTDAVCGVPADYAAAVLRNTIAMVAQLTTVDALVGSSA